MKSTNPMKLQAFHNKPQEKKFYVNRLLHHRKLEHLIQGTGWGSNGQTHGCAIGCLFEKYDHALGPKLIGIPEWLLRLCDFYFEKLPAKKANDFAVNWVKAVPVGADLEPLRHRLGIWRCEQSLARLKDNKEPYAVECRNAIQLVIAYHDAALNGDKSAARSAESAAWSAAESAESAWSAWSAARSAESAAQSAQSARSAAWSAGLNYIQSEVAQFLKLLKKS